MCFEMCDGKKIYQYSYEAWNEGGKSVGTMLEDILADPDFPKAEELIIGDWGECWEKSCQPVLDGIAEKPEQFSHIRKLFVGDMDFESCEVSWIIQGNYSRLWAAMPQLKELTIKGSTDLELGEVCHEGLEALTIICGGLPAEVIGSIRKAKLPNLKKLVLYIGVEDYGFDGDGETIRELLAGADFPRLEYLGIVDSEIQDELARVVLESRYAGQVETLDLSMGTLTDEGGALLLEKVPALSNLKKLDLHYNYLSDEMAEKLRALPIEVDVSEQNEEDEYDGEIYRNAMLTE